MQTTALNFGSLTWAIVVGINRYDSPDFDDLPTPNEQVSKVGEALCLKAGCSIPLENVALLPDCNAEIFLRTLKATVESSTVEDMLIIYFSGHGFRNEAGFQLCFQGATRETGSASCVSGKSLDDLLSNQPMRGVRLILDCCQSGGFAEDAPQFARSLNRAQFRLVLSASRSGEPSWELPDRRGTLFTHHLLQAIRGDEQISDKPGFIFFSELFNYVQQQVKRDLENLYPGVPLQEPVFVGIYAEDPLLFVHHALTLKQIKAKTDRYTRSYVIRIVRNWLVGLATAGAFVVGCWYTALDHATYLSLESNGLYFYQGIRSYNAFGFPKPIWTSNVADYMVKDGDPLRSHVQVGGKWGHDATNDTVPHLKPEFAIAALLQQRHINEAKSLLRSVVGEPPEIRSQFPGFIAGEWADVVTSEDEGTLTGMASRSDLQPFVVAQLYRGLVRIDSDGTLQTYFDLTRADYDCGLHVDHRLQGACGRGYCGSEQ